MIGLLLKEAAKAVLIEATREVCKDQVKQAMQAGVNWAREQVARRRL